MLKKFRIKDCKPISTPMIIGWKLRKYDESKQVDQRLYMSMMGSLLYVTSSRLDVIQEVGQVESFQATPKETTKFGIWYPKGNKLTLVSYIDVD